MSPALVKLAGAIQRQVSQSEGRQAEAGWWLLNGLVKLYKTFLEITLVFPAAHQCKCGPHKSRQGHSLAAGSGTPPARGGPRLV